MARLIFLMVVVTSASTDRQSDVNIETILDASDIVAEAIVDVNIEYEMRVVYEDMDAAIKKALEPGREYLLYRWPVQYQLQAKVPFSEFYRLQRSTLLGDLSNTGEPKSRSVVIQTYNGKHFKRFDTTETLVQSGKEIHRGIVSRRAESEFDIYATPLGYMGGIMILGFDGQHVALSEYMRLIQERGSFRIGTMEINDRLEMVAGPEKINGMDCVAVLYYRNAKHDDGKEYDTLAARVYFSPEHDFSLIRMEWLTSDGDVAFSQEVYKLERLPNGVWFPVECATRSVGQDGMTNIYSVKSVSVNQGLTAKDFDIEFPPGTRVSDRVTGKTYIVRPTEEQLEESLP